MNSKAPIFESARSFVVFSYNIERGLLLLRSRKANATPTRIDVLFQDVRAMELRSWFQGIKIEESDRQFLETARSKPVEMIEPGNRIYSLVGPGWTGFVVGGIVSVLEDNGEYTSPSGLMERKRGDK